MPHKGFSLAPEVEHPYRTPATEQALARDEAMLVGQARDCSYKGFRRVLAYWFQHADPDGTEDKAADLRDRRSFHLSKSLGGLWFGDVVLGPISGAIVANQLGRIEAELFEADWAEARSRLGEAARVTYLARPSAGPTTTSSPSPRGPDHPGQRPGRLCPPQQRAAPTTTPAAASGMRAAAAGPIHFQSGSHGGGPCCSYTDRPERR